MKCPRCQAENREGARFCRECGATFGAVCSGCGAQVEAGSKFCDSCGAPLAVTGAQSTTPLRFASPDSYTPKHLAERILTSKGVLEGERKQVTVLFADLKGSMELLADRDPEEARKLLDPILERMMEAVHRYEGTVNQVMGDGIMALFGAPIAHEDHAVRACYAALRMQESVKRHAEEVRRREGVLPQIRVGVNSGEVVVRSVGSDLRLDYTAVGQTTHLAARLEQMAAVGSTLISAETLRLAEGYVNARPIGPVPIKGLPGPVETYELTGAGIARTRLQAAAARGLTRFVGRDAELAQLRRALELAGSGHGQLVAVVGEAGVGKSRLLYEFVHSHRMHGWLVLESTSVSYGKATAYLPVIELLRGYFHIEGRDDTRRMSERVTGKLLTLDRALEPILPALLALLDLRVTPAEWQTLEPSERRQRTLDAVKQLLLREAQANPVLVVFEDLHWIDPETQAVLDGVVESLPTARLLLLVNYRPEYEHHWARKTYYTQLRIDPLPPQSAEEFLDALLGPGVTLRALKRLLIERTDGNPFFLEESVRTLVESHALVGNVGSYQPARPIEMIRLPSTVQAMLAARIDRLPPDAKRLLQSAAVIGKDVALPLLHALAEVPDSELRRSLAQLQAAEFLYETRLFPEAEYTFKHALTHEVAYGSLLQDRRRALHARVLDALERFSGDRIAEQGQRLAEHALRAEDWHRAARYLYLAGKQALAWGRYEEAGRCFETVVHAVSRQPEPRTRSLELDAYLELWVCRVGTGCTDGLEDLAASAEALARELCDRARLAHVRLRQAQAFWLVWDVPGALHAAVDRSREADELAEARDVRTRAYARFVSGAALMDLGRLEEAIAELDRGSALFRADGDSDELTRPILPSLRAWRAEALATLGRFAEALASAREAVAIADEIGQASGRAVARAILAYVYLIRGDFTQAASAARSGLELSEESALKESVAHSLYLACAELAQGDPGQGTERLGSVMKGRAPTDPFLRHWTKYGGLTATAWLTAGDVGAAEAEVDRGRAFASAREARTYLPTLFRLRGELLARRVPADLKGAASDVERALALATRLGLRPEVAHCHRSLGRLCRQMGERQQASEHLSTAAAMYRDMDMQFWVVNTERDLSLL